MSLSKNSSAMHKSWVHQSNGTRQIQAANGLALVPQPSIDPRDPLNWALRKKLRLLFTVCWCAWCGALAPPAGQLVYFHQVELYRRSPTELSYSINAAVAGLLGGPLIFVPIARILGRTSVIFWSLVGTFVCQIWAASMTRPDDYEAFIVSRLLAGLFGSPSTILGAGYIIDLFFLHQRGRAFSCYELSLLLGVICSPTIGGFIVEKHPWPVAFWWTLAPVGIGIILIFCFGEETGFARGNTTVAYPEAPPSFFQSRVATLFPGTQVAPRNHPDSIGKSFIAPLAIGISPVAAIAGLYMLISFGFTVMLAILLTIYLQTPVEKGGYGFSPARNAAFTFVSWFTVAVAQVISLMMSDKLPLWAAKKFNNGVWRPEYRVWNMWLPTIIAPIGLAIVGVTLQFRYHYMVLAFGTFLVNTSAQLAVPLLINYVIECFITRPVEVSVAMNVWRLAFGLAVGFAVEPWTESVGRGWMFGMASLFLLGASVFVAFLTWKGHHLRQLYPLRTFSASEEGERVVLAETES